MRASVGSEGAIKSPGRHCMKSLKTAAVFQTSSSSLPSITGGLSNFVMLTALFFSGVRYAARRSADVPVGAAADFAAAGVVAVESVFAPSAGALAGGVGDVDVAAAGVGVGGGVPTGLEGGEAEGAPLVGCCLAKNTSRRVLFV